MMNAEFDASMVYNNYDKKQEKSNYINGVTKKTLKVKIEDCINNYPRIMFDY